MASQHIFTPSSEEFDKLMVALHNCMASFEVDYSYRLGEVCLHTTVDKILDVIAMLRDHPNLRFQQMMDICGVDYLGRCETRFKVVYNLLSLYYNTRVRVTIDVNEGQVVPSITSLYSSAGWWEREAFDMYGILFGSHPDLRRLLTDYGFEGYPLRKDFPLTGYTEVRYDEEKKRVVYEPVTLTQGFRHFDFLSPWEGMTDVLSKRLLPGDEKAQEVA